MSTLQIPLRYVTIESDPEDYSTYLELHFWNDSPRLIARWKLMERAIPTGSSWKQSVDYARTIKDAIAHNFGARRIEDLYETTMQLELDDYETIAITNPENGLTVKKPNVFCDYSL
jgi:hypothetical protein